MPEEEHRHRTLAELREQEAQRGSDTAVLWREVADFEFSTRVANCLQNLHINFIGQLVQAWAADLLFIKNFGRKSLNQVKELLAQLGLSLGMTESNSSIKAFNAEYAARFGKSVGDDVLFWPKR